MTKMHYFKSHIASYLMKFHAKPGIAKDLIEAYEIGRKAVADFIDSLLVENLSFTAP